MSQGTQGGFGSPQSVVNAGDPLNIFGHSSNSVMSNIVDPGGLYGTPSITGGIPSTLPNLGAASMMPKAVQGAFQKPDLGGGGFNAVAARAAGPLFNPGIRAPIPGPATRQVPGTPAKPGLDLSDPQVVAALKRRFGIDGDKR